MKATNKLWYGAAGLIMVSAFLLTPPWTTISIILGIAPLLAMAIFAVALYRARNQQEDMDDNDEEPE